MIDVRLTELARHQDDLFAVWQLADWTKAQIEHRTAGLTRVHDGVVRLGTAPLTPRQRWRAATLTTPDSVLSHASAAAYDGYWRDAALVQIITRPGNGGPEQIGALLVLRSTQLDQADIVRDGGPPRTTVERTLIDLAVRLDAKQLRKAFREALRLRCTTVADVLAAVTRLRGRPGVARVRELAERYARLPIARCKSDAEAYALELLDAHGRPIPLVNESPAGAEADQYYPDLGRVIEIDGPDFHRLKDDDARKTKRWRAAGLTVDRISSDDVFDHPERYLALAPPRERRRRKSAPNVDPALL
jgi:hypothetical protein